MQQERKVDGALLNVKREEGRGRSVKCNKKGN